MPKQIPNRIRWRRQKLHEHVRYSPPVHALEHADGVNGRGCTLHTLAAPIEGRTHAVYSTDGRTSEFRGFSSRAAATRYAGKFLRGVTSMPYNRQQLQGGRWIIG